MMDSVSGCSLGLQGGSFAVKALGSPKDFEDSLVRHRPKGARRRTEGGLIVLVELDNFSSLTARYGSVVAAAALRLVGEFLAAEVRPTDVAAQVGKDEFALFLPGARREDILTRVQKLAWNLNNLSFIWNGEEIGIGASVGLKSYPFEEESPPLSFTAFG